MPKGRLMTLNTAYSIECKKTGTSRIFQSEKELKTYSRRHDIFCDCGMNEVTGVKYSYDSMRPVKLEKNEL